MFVPLYLPSVGVGVAGEAAELDLLFGLLAGLGLHTLGLAWPSAARPAPDGEALRLVAVVSVLLGLLGLVVRLLLFFDLLQQPRGPLRLAQFFWSMEYVIRCTVRK